MILLNGPPGVGKSTVARMYAHAHPLSLNLDIDQIRSLIGGWRDTHGQVANTYRTFLASLG